MTRIFEWLQGIRNVRNATLPRCRRHIQTSIPAYRVWCSMRWPHRWRVMLSYLTCLDLNTSRCSDWSWLCPSAWPETLPIRIYLCYHKIILGGWQTYRFIIVDRGGNSRCDWSIRIQGFREIRHRTRIEENGTKYIRSQFRAEEEK